MADLRTDRPLRRLRTLWRDNRAATAVEYGLILALIVLGVMSALIGLGGQSQSTWGNIHDKVRAVSPR